MVDIFKKTTNKIKGRDKSRSLNSHIYWVMLVRFFLGMALALIIFSFYLLYEIRNEKIFQVSSVNSENPPTLINDKLLIKVNDSLEKKEMKNKEIESGDIVFVDPS